jgi:hypothetical protein
VPAPEEARWWSWRRQRLDRTARSIDDALRSVIAITSTNPSAPLALLARVPRMMTGMYEGAIRARSALRLPAMRHAVWLLAGETAHVPFHALRGTGASESNLLRRNGIGPEHWNILRERVLDACKQPVTARQIRDAVGEDGEKIGAVLSVLMTTGEVVRVHAPTLLSNAFTFVATESWLGHALPAMQRDDALAFLAGDYLQAYGPVTVDDFVWWTGLPRNRCEPALVSHEPVSLADGYLLWPGHVRAFEQSRPVANRVSLLPAWDPYPMGYASRERLGSPDAIAAAVDRNGNSLPVVLVEGAIAGLWDFALDRGQNCTITFRMFEEPGARLREGIESEAGAVAHLFQARSLKLVRARHSSRSRTTSKKEEPAPPAHARPRARRARPSAKRARPSAKRAPAKKRAAAKKKAPAKRVASKVRTGAKRAAAKKSSAGKARVSVRRVAAKKRAPVKRRAAPAKRSAAKRRAHKRKR